MSKQNSVVNLSEQLRDLQPLQDELHRVNEELAKASRPLDRFPELNGEQRRQVAEHIRAGLARWETVTQRIAMLLGIESANGNKAEEGEPR